MSTQLEGRLIAEIGQIIDDYIAPIFQPGARITVLVRHPGMDDADAVVTSDTDDGIHALVHRRFPRAADADIARLSAALAEKSAQLEEERARNAAPKVVGYISKTGHGTYFRESITPALAALEFAGVPMWRPVSFAKPAHPLAIIPGADPK